MPCSSSCQLPQVKCDEFSKGPTVEQYLAEEAIGLISSLNWNVVEANFWNKPKYSMKEMFKDLPHNSVYMEPEYG